MYLLLTLDCADDSANCDVLAVRLTQELFDVMAGLVADFRQLRGRQPQLSEIRVEQAAAAAEVYSFTALREDFFEDTLNPGDHDYARWKLWADIPLAEVDDDAGSEEDAGVFSIRLQELCCSQLPCSASQNLALGWALLLDAVDALAASYAPTLAEWRRIATLAGCRFESPDA